MIAEFEVVWREKNWCMSASLRAVRWHRYHGVRRCNIPALTREGEDPRARRENPHNEGAKQVSERNGL